MPLHGVASAWAEKEICGGASGRAARICGPTINVTASKRLLSAGATVSVGLAHRRAELPHNVGEQRSLSAVHDCVLNVDIETVHGACDGAAVLQSCRCRVDLLSHGSVVGPAVAIMDIIGVSPSEDNPSRVRMGVAQQLRVEVNIVSVGRIANYAAAIVILWGLARRTARQIEKVSLFYIVVICSQS